MDGVAVGWLLAEQLCEGGSGPIETFRCELRQRQFAQSRGIDATAVLS
jgi:hypothetical protein